MIIGLIGKKGVGKTTLARKITEEARKIDIDAEVLSFSTPLKEMIMKSGLVSFEEVYGSQKTELSRKLMQFVGTEVIREISPNYFIYHMAENLGKWGETLSLTIIDDARFKNEADLIKSYDGILVRICADFAKDDNDNHASEIEQDSIEADMVFLNNFSDDIESIGKRAFLEIILHLYRKINSK